MQLKTALLSLFAAAASAAPAGKSCPAPTRKFGIMALRSASDIHFAQVSATQNRLVLHQREETLDADCADGNARRDAIFYIKNGELYLYGSDTVQQFFVDRSGMGQGVTQYFNKGPTSPGGRLELSGWEVDEHGYLTFNGSGFLACPSTVDDSWNVWINAGVEKPAGQEGCLGFSALTVTTADPVKCTYSLYSA